MRLIFFYCSLFYCFITHHISHAYHTHFGNTKKKIDIIALFQALFSPPFTRIAFQLYTLLIQMNPSHTAQLYIEFFFAAQTSIYKCFNDSCTINVIQALKFSHNVLFQLFVNFATF